RGECVVAHARWRFLTAAASGAGNAVPGRVALPVDHGHFPAGVRRSGGGIGEVTRHGWVEGAEEPVLSGPGREALHRDQRDRHLGRRGRGSSADRAVAAVIWAGSAAGALIASGAFAVAGALAVAGVLAVAVRSLTADSAIAAACRAGLNHRTALIVPAILIVR